MLAAVALSGALLLLPRAGASFPPAPNYQQCDPGWANVPMGTKGDGEDSTICGEGCAMSSLAMALAAFGARIPIGGSAEIADPLTLNSWLEAHQGYTCAAGDCNNLVLDAVTRLNASWTLVGEVPPYPPAQMGALLLAGHTTMLAHVRNRTHFALLTGVVGAADSGVYSCNDPNHNVSTYGQDEIADIIVYAVAPTPPSSGPSSPPAAADQLPAVPPPRPSAPASSRPTAAFYRRMGAAASPVVPFAYPLFKQCDGAWGSDPIGNETSVTVCDVGCLMSSVSMALARNNITLPDLGGSAHWETANPQSLNTWLQLNRGYDDGDEFDEDDLPALNPAHVSWNDTTGMHRSNDVPLATVQAYLSAGQPVIANVLQGRHFVLVVGWDAAAPDTLLVNDPGFDTLSYSYSKDVVGWRLFGMVALPFPGAPPSSPSSSSSSSGGRGWR